MEEDQLERLIDVLARIHVELVGLRHDLRSGLEELAIRSARMTG